jgi:hypothetical protein
MPRHAQPSGFVFAAGGGPGGGAGGRGGRGGGGLGLGGRAIVATLYQNEIPRSLAFAAPVLFRLAFHGRRGRVLDLDPIV